MSSSLMIAAENLEHALLSSFAWVRTGSSIFIFYFFLALAALPYTRLGMAMVGCTGLYLFEILEILWLSCGNTGRFLFWMTLD